MSCSNGATSRSSPSCPIFGTRRPLLLSMPSTRPMDTAAFRSAWWSTPPPIRPHTGTAMSWRRSCRTPSGTARRAQPAVPLYRRLLAGQPNHSVTVVALGGDTNLAGLLRSGPGQGSSLPGRGARGDQGETARDRRRALPDRGSSVHQRTSGHRRHQDVGRHAGLADGDRLGRRVSQVSTRKWVAASAPLCRRRTRCASSTRSFFIAGHRETVTGTVPRCCTRSMVLRAVSSNWVRAAPWSSTARVDCPGGQGWTIRPRCTSMSLETALNDRINSLLESS